MANDAAAPLKIRRPGTWTQEFDAARLGGMAVTSRFLILFVVAFTSVCGGCGAARPLERFEYTRLCMGVQAKITLFAREESHAFHGAAAAFGVIAQLEASMSDYRRDSELSRLSLLPVNQPAVISRELSEVLTLSQMVAQDSGGAFDVTVGPLVSQWREARTRRKLPDTSDRLAAMARVGWQSMELDADARSVRLKKAGMKLDLGGVAKGYAAQRAVDELRMRGMSRCLVALAGDVVAGDPPPGAEGWAVEMPEMAREENREGILLANAAISTSGNAEQFIDIDGVRYSHIVDPRTGLGLTAARTVTVLAPSGELADAISTALCVAGPEWMHPMTEIHPGIAILMIDATTTIIHDPRHRFRLLTSALQ